METAKQKAIREAYFEEFRISGTKEENLKERFDAIRCALDYSGWFEGKLYDVCNSRIDISGHECRPKSLQGIETNNGWITIESEADLPKETEEMWVKHNDGDILTLLATPNYLLKNCTHYQPIEKPKPPIY